MLFKELWRLLLLKYLFLQRTSLWRIFEHQGIYIKKHQLTSQRRNKTPLKSGAHSLCRKNQIHNSPLDHIELWVMSSLWIGCQAPCSKNKTSWNRSWATFGHRGQLWPVCNIFNPTHLSIFSCGNHYFHPYIHFSVTWFFSTYWYVFVNLFLL